MTGKKWLQRGLAIGLSAAMCFSFAPTDNLVGISEVFAEEAEETESFTLYYYDDSADPTLYVDIWNHSGIEFADSASVGWAFEWKYKQAVMQAVEGNENWYQTEITVLSAENSDGFDIYRNSSNDKIYQCDNEWHNSEVYATLVGGGSSAYAIKDGTLYTDLADAGISLGQVSDEDDPVEAAINVDKVVDLTEDFIMGMDISSVMCEFKSGVTYKDFDGNPINNIADFCTFLKSCGVTTIRVRVWNDPTDSDKNSYGGGANDIATAVEIARGCAAADLGMLIDFHCSDFWTDPSKQQAPKAWAKYTLEQKEDALKTFITDSLTQIRATGAKISMVQVGNETNNGFIGETSVANMCALFNAGSAAIRKVDGNIKVVIHVTNPEKSNMTKWAKNLADNNVDYDVLATSYYPSWHGTFANLKSQMQEVKNTYGKDVMVAETSYAYTLEDTDGHENTLREGTNDTMECETQYPFSAQGQASYLRDLINTVNEAGGLGVFYWEPAWITVGDTTGLTGDEYSAKVADNQELWEKNGSGWASSYASDYDPDDAGKWYGGSAVDNQALFAADGSPLASINVWKYVRTGAYTNSVSVEKIASAEETVEEGSTYTLPDTLTVTYNKGSAEEAVSWDEVDIEKINTSVVGTYVVNGTVTFSKTVNDGTYSGQESAVVTYTLTVKAKNLIGDDWSFENGGSNFSGLAANGTDITKDDPKDGTHALHWWLASEGNSAVTYLGEGQNGITLSPGTYTFEVQTQGSADKTGDTVALSILEHGTDSVLAVGEAVTLNGWLNWIAPTVSFEVTSETTIDLQMNVGIQENGWGTIDCMYLYRTGDVETADGKAPADAKKPTVNKTTPSSTTKSNTALVVIEDESVPIADTGTEDMSDETTSATGNAEATASGTVAADRNITVTSDESEEADDASEETADDSINSDETDGNADAGLTDDTETTAIADEDAPLSAATEKNTFRWYWLLLLAAVAAVIGKMGYDYKKKQS
jgi:arabinogalactan endo-1,4-beta-galactosidase